METGSPRSDMRICESLLPYGNPRIGTRIDVISIPEWKRGVPVPIWGLVNPHYHTLWAGNFGFLAKILGGTPVHL